MINIKEIKKSLIASIWFAFLTFPIVVMKIDFSENIIIFRWKNLFLICIGSFFLSWIWRYFSKEKTDIKKNWTLNFLSKFYSKKVKISFFLILCIFVIIFPFIFSSYQVNIMTTALMYIVLGLGLNIVVGQAGLLDLGYVAFYALGAYTYALLNHHFGFSFWVCIPISAFLAALAGIILGFPVLRLRGDYLAIVTLGFGEIIRLILENWDKFSFGPSGISQIPRPSFFSIKMTGDAAIIYIYFIVLALVLFTVFMVNRLQDSRIGRAWLALREDEIACQAMGIDKTRTKLRAFALGATWAGMVGAIFAAKTTFINPASFTFLESAIILSIVVLGGMGSILGVSLGALILILLPEYLRELGNYRMLAFGASMVIIMVFRPQGLISNVRKVYSTIK